MVRMPARSVRARHQLREKRGRAPDGARRGNRGARVRRGTRERRRRLAQSAKAPAWPSLFLPRVPLGARIVSVMPRKSASPHPVVQRLLKELGENIRLARLRRGFSMELVAERAGMSRPTLRAVESGEPGVTLGSYANVLHSLGLHGDLAVVARDDELGRKLPDAELPTRRRAPKRTVTQSSSKQATNKDRDEC